MTDAFVIGLAMTRSILANPSMTGLSRDELARVGRTRCFGSCSTGPAPS